MAKVTKQMVDKDLRERVFKNAIYADNDEVAWFKINDRQYGCILTDMNGDERYIRIGAIVAELRDDMTARELMEAEIEEYKMKQEAKAKNAKAKEAKIAKDKARREKEKEAKENVQ